MKFHMNFLEKSWDPEKERHGDEDDWKYCLGVISSRGISRYLRSLAQLTSMLESSLFCLFASTILYFLDLLDLFSMSTSV
jgi:hypothetical protein